MPDREKYEFAPADIAGWAAIEADSERVINTLTRFKRLKGSRLYVVRGGLAVDCPTTRSGPGNENPNHRKRWGISYEC